MTSAEKDDEASPEAWDKLPKFALRGRRGETYKKLGRKVIEIEQAAVKLMAERIDDEFVRACRYLRGCRDKGRVVVMGVGKSGHVGSKIAATLASTGTPAFFVHPGEAAHGDLGMITRNDVVLALSNSGKTLEILTLLPAIEEMGIPLVAMTGNPDSPLARAARVHLNVRVEEEACPLELAPTASTTAALAMGDALAIAILQAEEKTPEDFARSHPGGALGKKLLLRVSSVMHSGDRMPAVGPAAPLRDALLEMTRKGLGMTAIVDEQQKVLGIFTDGDLRRTLDREVDLRTTPIDQVMTRDCKVIRADAMAVEAMQIMKAHKINALIAVDARGRMEGALNMHDLLRAGID